MTVIAAITLWCGIYALTGSTEGATTVCVLAIPWFWVIHFNIPP